MRLVTCTFSGHAIVIVKHAVPFLSINTLFVHLQVDDFMLQLQQSEEPTFRKLSTRHLQDWCDSHREFDNHAVENNNYSEVFFPSDVHLPPTVPCFTFFHLLRFTTPCCAT